jgi:FtsH-binding integral membrane protein
MSDFNRGYPRAATVGVGDMSIDVGLRGFMLGVYNKVALGLVLSAALAYVTSSVPAVRELLFRYTIDGRLAGYTLLGMVVAFAPLGVLVFTSFANRNPTPASSGAIYWTVVALLGASMGVLVLLYTGAALSSTFLITAASFAGLSLVGYTTKKDLTAMGSFLIMGLIGIILAMVVNVFLGSALIDFFISVLGVGIFAGLIAYDTQRLKATYYQLGGDQAAMSVATNYGALNLYLDFINLFRFLLALFGGRR